MRYLHESAVPDRIGRPIFECLDEPDKQGRRQSPEAAVKAAEEHRQLGWGMRRGAPRRRRQCSLLDVAHEISSSWFLHAL